MTSAAAAAAAAAPAASRTPKPLNAISGVDADLLSCWRRDTYLAAWRNVSRNSSRSFSKSFTMHFNAVTLSWRRMSGCRSECMPRSSSVDGAPSDLGGTRWSSGRRRRRRLERPDRTVGLYSAVCATASATPCRAEVDSDGFLPRRTPESSTVRAMAPMSGKSDDTADVLARVLHRGGGVAVAGAGTGAGASASAAATPPAAAGLRDEDAVANIGEWWPDALLTDRRPDVDSWTGACFISRSYSGLDFDARRRCAAPNATSLSHVSSPSAPPSGNVSAGRPAPVAPGADTGVSPPLDPAIGDDAAPTTTSDARRRKPCADGDNRPATGLRRRDGCGCGSAGSRAAFRSVADARACVGTACEKSGSSGADAGDSRPVPSGAPAVAMRAGRDRRLALLEFALELPLRLVPSMFRPLALLRLEDDLEDDLSAFVESPCFTRRSNSRELGNACS